MATTDPLSYKVVIKLYDSEGGGDVLNKDYLVNVVVLGDTIAFPGTVASNMVAGFIITNYGEGICIHNLWFMLALEAPSGLEGTVRCIL